MTRDLFMEKMESYIETAQIYEVNYSEIKAKFSDDEGKMGIYFLYGDNDEVIYVGMTSEGKYTSFYHRMYGHGNGAHKNKSWFGECKKFRFKKLPTMTREELYFIERLMIFKKGQPKYNDIKDTAYNLDEIFKRVKEGGTDGEI